jgi:hypothetical protein
MYCRIYRITKNQTPDKRNPPPLTVSCAPSVDEDHHCLRLDKRKQKTKEPVLRADKSPGLCHGDIDLFIYLLRKKIKQRGKTKQ